jgi:hypothetical protein
LPTTSSYVFQNETALRCAAKGYRPIFPALAPGWQAISPLPIRSFRRCHPGFSSGKFTFCNQLNAKRMNGFFGGCLMKNA